MLSVQHAELSCCFLLEALKQQSGAFGGRRERGGERHREKEREIIKESLFIYIQIYNYIYIYFCRHVCVCVSTRVSIFWSFGETVNRKKSIKSVTMASVKLFTTPRASIFFPLRNKFRRSLPTRSVNCVCVCLCRPQAMCAHILIYGGPKLSFKAGNNEQDWLMKGGQWR